MTKDTRDNAAIARAGFQSFGTGITSEIDKIVMRAGLIIQNAAQKKTPVNTGLLRSSITTRLDKTEKKVSAEIGTNVDYAPFIEFGSSPHQSPDGSQEFVESMLRWGHLHGMDDSQSWAVIQHIRKNGTKPKPFLTPALDENRATVQDQINSEIADFCNNFKGAK